MFRELVLGAAGAAAFVGAASAHVTLETREAPVGTPYKAVLRVPHGCEGAATVALRVRVPEGMIAVKPMPKPGWKIETVTGKYPKTYSYFHSAKLSEGVTEGFLAGDLEAGKMLFPGGAGMRARRSSLDRNSGRRKIVGRLSRTGAGVEALAQAVIAADERVGQVWRALDRAADRACAR